MAYQYNIGPSTHTGRLCNASCTGMWGGMNWFLPMVASSWRNGSAREYYVTVTLYTRFPGTYWSMFNGIYIHGVSKGNRNLNVSAANTDFELAQHNFGPYYFNTDGTPANGALTFVGGCYIKPYTYCSGGSCGGGRVLHHQGGSVTIRHENIEPAYTAPTGLTVSHTAKAGEITFDYTLGYAGQSSHIVRYELYIRKDDEGWGSPVLTNYGNFMSGKFKYTIPNPENAKPYHYLIKAVNNNNLALDNYNILATPTPPQVIVDVTSASSKLEADARIASSGSSSVWKWVIRTKKHGQNAWQNTKWVTSDLNEIRLVTDHDIEFNTVYDYEVAVYNNHGLYNTYTNVSGTTPTAPQARWWLINRQHQRGTQIKLPRIMTHNNVTKDLYFIYGLHPQSLGNLKVGDVVKKWLVLPKSKFTYYPGILGEITFENGKSFKATRMGTDLVIGEFKGNNPITLWYSGGQWKINNGQIGGDDYIVKSISPNINKSILFNAIKLKKPFTK